jgi:hypothetical protein
LPSVGHLTLWRTPWSKLKVVATFADAVCPCINLQSGEID